MEGDPLVVGTDAIVEMFIFVGVLSVECCSGKMVCSSESCEKILCLRVGIVLILFLEEEEYGGVKEGNVEEEEEE